MNIYIDNNNKENVNNMIIINNKIKGIYIIIILFVYIKICLVKNLLSKIIILWHKC